MSIEAIVQLRFYDKDDNEIVKKCEVTVREDSAENGHGECPTYPYQCSIESIMCDGVDITIEYGSDNDRMFLAMMISDGEFKDAEETKASKQYDEQNRGL